MSARLALVLAGAVGIQNPSGASDPEVKVLLGLESEWNEAHIRGDVDRIDHLWADELVIIIPGVAPFSKAEALSFLRSRRVTFPKYETSEVVARRYADTALVFGRLRRSRATEGRVFEDDLRFSKVYVRRSGRWQVVAYHTSQTGE